MVTKDRKQDVRVSTPKTKVMSVQDTYNEVNENDDSGCGPIRVRKISIRYSVGVSTFPKNTAADDGVAEPFIVRSVRVQTNVVERGQLEEGARTERFKAGDHVNCILAITEETPPREALLELLR
jgi:hypothetical protein